MIRILLTMLLLLTTGCAAQNHKTSPAPALSFEAMHDAWVKAAAVGPEHQRLATLKGSWKVTSTFWSDPAKKPETSKGSATFTPVLGGRFIKQEYKGSAMGMKMAGLGYLGYDNMKGAYTSSWMDSLSTTSYASEGSYDSTQKTWTFISEVACPFANGEKMAVKDVLKIVDKNHLLFEVFQTRPDGNEMKVLELKYSR